jgi:hypothetical protein
MAEGHKTFQLRYVGARFEGARLPLDVLSDLPAFRDLLVSYAKDSWRKLNLDRERLPRGFDQSISFDLVSIEEGSAMAKLDWSRKMAQAMLPEFTDELEELVDRSYGDLVQLVDGAGHDRFPAALSSEHIRALNKLGAGLRESERIEFLGSSGADGNVVYLDTFRRKALITRVRETYQARFEGIGRLIGLHTGKPSGLHPEGYIAVDTAEHGELRIPVDPVRVSEEFDGNTGSEVQFSLLIELDNKDRFRNVIETFDVELIDAAVSEHIKRCRARLSELRKLSAGWLDGSGSPIKTTAINLAEAFLNKRPAFAEAYRLYPTEDGGVLFEFLVKGWDLSLEFGPAGGIEMYGVEVDGAGEMQPCTFSGLSDEFNRAFDALMAR